MFIPYSKNNPNGGQYPTGGGVSKEGFERQWLSGLHNWSGSSTKEKGDTTRREEENKPNLCLPYIVGLGEDLRRICKKNTRSVLVSAHTLPFNDSWPGSKIRNLQTGDLEWYTVSPGVVVWSTLGNQRGPWRQESVSTRQLSEEERQNNQQLPIIHGPTSITWSGRTLPLLMVLETNIYCK